jgi:hypothetical protein
LTDNGTIGRRDAMRELGQKYGMSTKAVYAAVERAKTSGE